MATLPDWCLVTCLFVLFAYGPNSVVVADTSIAYADGVNYNTLTCVPPASYRDANFQWTKGGTSIGDNSDKFIFIPVPADDGEVFVCIVTKTGLQKEQVRGTITLTVYYGPKSVNITGDPVYADGTNRLTLTCTAEEYNPDVGFQWKEGNQNISGQNTSTYTKIAEKTDNGRTVTCLTWNTLYTNKTKETSTQLTVYYGPDSAIVAGTSTVYADGVNTLTFTCTTADSYPGVSFQWTKGGTSIGDNSDTLTFTPVPTDDGKDVVCIASNTAHLSGQARDNVTLSVYSTETDDLKTEDITVITQAGAVAGSVGVLLIVIAIVVVLWRRGVITKPNSSCLKEDSGQNVYQNEAFDPVTAEGSSTNEAIYQELGPSENPDMHYESMTDIGTVHRTS